MFNPLIDAGTLEGIIPVTNFPLVTIIELSCSLDPRNFGIPVNMRRDVSFLFDL